MARCCGVERKGHTQLAVRCVATVGQFLLSLSLGIAWIDPFHSLFVAFFQLMAAWSLGYQYLTGSDLMFAVRGVASFGKCAAYIHLSGCGRLWVGVCDPCPWRGSGDARTPLRVLHALAAVRFLLNGMSLMTQFAAPSLRTRPFRGHDELLRRSKIRIGGTPIHLARAFLKIFYLRGTPYARTTHEIVVNFLRALILIPISAWSLRRQWLHPPRREFASSAAAAEDSQAGQRPSVKDDFFVVKWFTSSCVRRSPSRSRSLSLRDLVDRATVEEETEHQRGGSELTAISDTTLRFSEVDDEDRKSDYYQSDYHCEKKNREKTRGKQQQQDGGASCADDDRDIVAIDLVPDKMAETNSPSANNTTR